MEPTKGDDGRFLRPISFRSGNVIAEIEENQNIDGRIWPHLRLYRIDTKSGMPKLASQFTLGDAEHLSRVTAAANSFMLNHFVKAHRPSYYRLSWDKKKHFTSGFKFD